MAPEVIMMGGRTERGEKAVDVVEVLVKA
jgi:hypothetical protein